jgi:hypothetical protein
MLQKKALLASSVTLVPLRLVHVFDISNKKVDDCVARRFQTWMLLLQLGVQPVPLFLCCMLCRWKVPGIVLKD